MWKNFCPHFLSWRRQPPNVQKNYPPAVSYRQGTSGIHHRTSIAVSTHTLSAAPAA
jgi:hypothetical protein